MTCLGWFVAGGALGFIVGVAVVCWAALWWARREKTTRVALLNKEQLSTGYNKTVH